MQKTLLRPRRRKRLRSSALALAVFGLLVVARPALANPAPAIVEIDPRVEVDARAARRLVQLELSDVEVPKRPQDPDVALFVRVLAGGEGKIRVELWERGESYGARLVTSSRGGAQLVARRVALAAAELARALRQKRRVLERQRKLEEQKRLAAERAERERTLDGPVAIRSAAVGTLVGLDELALLGPSLTGQIHVTGATRVDIGATALFGRVLDADAAVETLELSLGPAHRIPVPSLGLDLDLAAFARAGVLSFADVAGVDGIAGQRQTWWARAGAASAIELRLSRHTRLSLGFSFGAVLRRVPVMLDDSRELGLGGLFLGTELGLVYTPEPRVRPTTK
jgi:hypothetical protein